MSRKAGFWASTVLAALGTGLVVAAAAVAAGGAAPRLLSPNHKRVPPGHIRLVVNIPLKPASHGVFIAISNMRRLDKSGHLKGCTSLRRCDFVGPTHWKGHRYKYQAHYSFSGYWAVTPGRYFWQVHYYPVGNTAVYYSGIGSFVVK